MRARPVDASGDMMPIASDDQMLTGGKAVAQIVEQRLRFYKGSWWEDPELGFSVPKMLAENPTRNNLNMLAKYITSYIAGTEGVLSVSNVITSFEHRSFFYSAYINTGTGREVVEVSLDGLL